MSKALFLNTKVTLSGSVPLFTSCREGVFSQTQRPEEPVDLSQKGSSVLKNSLVPFSEHRSGWTCPGTTDTRTLRTIDPQNKEVLSAKGKTAISTRVQGRGRRTGPIFGQIHLTDRQGPWSLRHLFEKLG